MPVKQVQFAYDTEWYKRKMNLGKHITWKLIMEKGIEAIEILNNNIEIEKKTKLEQKNEPFQIDISNIFTDILHENKWVEIHNSDIRKKDIIRFRTQDDIIKSINGKKRFEVIKKPKITGKDKKLLITILPMEQK